MNSAPATALIPSSAQQYFQFDACNLVSKHRAEVPETVEFSHVLISMHCGIAAVTGKRNTT